MLIRLSKFSGYCFGVKRAVSMALEARKNADEVFTLGELIHNPSTVRELEARGIKVANEASELHNSTVVIRSHGVPRKDLELLRSNGNTVVDATCPYVNRIHDIIKEMVDAGYPVWIMGDINHPEVQGMLSYGNDKTRVISPGTHGLEPGSNRLCLVAQTTCKLQNFHDLACELLPRLLELRIFNTICLATSQRQDEAVKLAKQSDIMIIVGGHNSSNTKALAALCSQLCHTIHIETYDELPELDYRDDLRIGIAAGASTPEEMILRVYNKIIDKSGTGAHATSIGDIPLFKEES